MPSLGSPSDTEVARIFRETLAHGIGADRFALWWNDSIRIELEAGTVILVVDNTFLLERLKSRLFAELSGAAKEAFGPSTQIAFKLAASTAEAKPKVRPKREKRPNRSCGEGPAAHNGIKTLGSVSHSNAPPVPNAPVKTLADFLIGTGNQLAAAAAQLVAAQPGAANPLYIHGPTGCGKSHLLEAIRHQYRTTHAVRRVILLTAEEFTNDFMGALQGSGLPGFRRRYRDVESLLVDDIQFLDGKRSTVREFQHTIDTLLRSGRQLVFTADRPPMELDGIGSELAGRLAGGMVCGIGSMDQGTRHQLLQRLASHSGIRLGRGVAEQIADRLAGDGRLIQGLMYRLKAVSNFVQGDMSWEVITQYASDLLDASARTVALADIQKAVCETFNLPAAALQSRGQQQVYSQPRMLAMYLARKYTRAALSEIGEYFGERSHSTVIAANKRVERWLNQGNTLRRGERSIEISSAVQTIERQLRVS